MIYRVPLAAEVHANSEKDAHELLWRVLRQVEDQVRAVANDAGIVLVLGPLDTVMEWRDALNDVGGEIDAALASAEAAESALENASGRIQELRERVSSAVKS